MHFINEKSGEFLFFKLSVTGTAAGSLELINMQAPLRQLSRHMLPLTNPLEADVSFTAAVDRADVSVPATLVVPAHGRAELPIEWRPLLPKDGTAKLTLQSAELGAFLYDLNLTALPAGEQKSLGFKVSLGEAQTLRFRFVNFLRRPETYKLSLAGGESDFAVEASVSAPAAESTQGVEVSLRAFQAGRDAGDAHRVERRGRRVRLPAKGRVAAAQAAGPDWHQAGRLGHRVVQEHLRRRHRLCLPLRAAHLFGGQAARERGRQEGDARGDHVQARARRAAGQGQAHHREHRQRRVEMDLLPARRAGGRGGSGTPSGGQA